MGEKTARAGGNWRSGGPCGIYGSVKVEKNSIGIRGKVVAQGMIAAVETPVFLISLPEEESTSKGSDSNNKKRGRKRIY